MIIDLTHRFTDGMPVYPGDAPPRIEQTHALESDGSNSSRLSSGMHVGTHIDAPMHMSADPRTLADFPLETFAGPGVLARAGQGVEEAALCRAVRRAVRPGDIVLIWLGWGERLREPDYFTGFPRPCAALIDAALDGGAKLIGLDIASPDGPPFALHKQIFARGVPLAENLVGLGALSAALPDGGLAARGFEVFAIPLRIEAEGSLARVFARVP